MIVKHNVSLSRFTTFGVGGAVSVFLLPSSLNEVIEAYSYIFSRNLSLLILGGGSNLLVADNLNGVGVIASRKLNKVYVNGNKILAQAGATATEVSIIAYENGLSGVEFLYGLPGTIAGAAHMNARAYGQEMSEVVSSITVVSPKGEVIHLSKQDLKYSYKYSILQDELNNYFIYVVEMELTPSAKSFIRQRMESNFKRRVEAGHFVWPSAGCIFKNNYSLGASAGKLIDFVGLKGTKLGGAMVSPYHANFIVNYNNASAEDIYQLVRLVQRKVFESLGVKLEPEIKFVGFDDNA